MSSKTISCVIWAETGIGIRLDLNICVAGCGCVTLGSRIHLGHTALTAHSRHQGETPREGRGSDWSK